MGRAHPFVATEVRLTLTCLTVAILYYLASQFGLAFAYEQANTSPFWPPSGLSVALVLILGYRIWPGIYLGAFITTLSVGAPVSIAMMIALGNTCEAVLAAYLTIRLIDSRYPLAHPHHVFKFVFAAAILATAVSAYVGSLSLLFGGLVERSDIISIFMTWWFGDMGGVVLIAPLILSMTNKLEHKIHKRQLAEAMVLIIATVGISYYVFGGLSHLSAEKYPLAFLVLPVLIWSAFRFGARGSTTVIMLIAAIAISGTVNGYGPFDLPSANESIILLQSFIGLIAVTTLALAALVKQNKLATASLRHAHDNLEISVAERTHELRETNTALAKSEAKWRSITESSPDNIMLVDPDGKILFINNTVPDLSVDQVIGTSVYDYVAVDQQAAMRRCYELVLQTGKPCQFNIDYPSSKGIINFENRVGPVINDNKIVALTVSCRDVTGRRKKEAEIARLNNRMGLLLESTSEGIFGVDNELRCTFINRAAAELLGMEVAEIVGTDMYDLLYSRYADGSRLPREECLVYRTIDENRIYISDDELFWVKGGESFPVQLTSNPITQNGDVIGAAVVFHNVSEARAIARKMDYLTAHDPLTGLVNRREFELRVQRALDSAITENSRHVLCYLDLDQFKVVNDTCGHIAGDELLRQVTHLLQENVRQNDTLSRLGGDEFGILMLHCDIKHSLKVIETIRSRIEGFKFVWEDKPYGLSASIGITALTSLTASVGDAMSEADSACYMAKDTGRNRVHVYQADDAVMAQRHGEMQWVSRIHQAFTDQRLSLVCQPIMSTEDLVGNFTPDADQEMLFEVLIRMTDENGKRIPPIAFIPAAERYNLMPSIDRWVVRTMLKWLHDHHDQLDQMTFCTINLSGHSLNDQQFLSFVCDQLEKSAVSGEKICFEITETAAVANLSQAIQFIKILKGYGCRFALDDFGSGMSSFAYLKNLPVDFLKIDGNFVRDIANDPVDYAMVEAVNTVGHVMGIKTIAEFVENNEVLSLLHKLGVDYVQGYAIAMPQSLDELFAQPKHSKREIKQKEYV